jgi:hypothetical protein
LQAFLLAPVLREINELKKEMLKKMSELKDALDADMAMVNKLGTDVVDAITRAQSGDPSALEEAKAIGAQLASLDSKVTDGEASAAPDTSGGNA